ncbi:MAG: hypothetical protein CMJ40_02475 [Phycisphaerae bacterium]|nr:hypothetical protein [Phycisphaerae bacterium]
MLTGAVFAATPSSDISSSNLQARLEAAEAKIAQLSSQQDADWLTEQRSEEIREIVQDVLADADTRASLQGSNMSAGYDNGFVISSSDGKWKLRINGLLQNRWILSNNRTPNTPLSGPALAAQLRNTTANPAGSFVPSQNYANNPTAAANTVVPVVASQGWDQTGAAGTPYANVVDPRSNTGALDAVPVNPGVGQYVTTPAGTLALAPGATSAGFGFPFQYGNRTNDGFETTRAAINLSGLVAQDYYYNMRLNWSPYNTTNEGVATQLSAAGFPERGVAAATPNPGISEGVLEWAYGGIKFNDEFSVQIGRQKYDVMRGFMVNAEYQQAIERSLYTYFWGTTNLTNGIKVKWDSDMFRANAMYSNASQSFAQDAQSPYYTNGAEYAFSGRFEWLAHGTWEQFDQISSAPGEEMGILAGVGAAYLDSDSDLWPYTGRSDWQVTGDLSMNMNGWNVMGSISVGDSQNSSNNNPWGFEVSGGMYLMDDVELYGRYQWLDPAYSDIYGSNADLNMVTFGANWYLAGNNAKLSLDWSWSFNQVVALGSGYGYTNWLPSGTNGGEWLLRTQLQLFF